MGGGGTPRNVERQNDVVRNTRVSVENELMRAGTLLDLEKTAIEAAGDTLRQHGGKSLRRFVDRSSWRGVYRCAASKFVD